MIYIGADHRGFALKNTIKQYLTEHTHAYEDCGALVYDEHDDFVDFAIAVADHVSQHVGARGILICRNGAGMDIVANKHKNIRAVIGFHPEQVRLARNDDNINIISLASDFTDEGTVFSIIDMFLNTPFEAADRQTRRLQKIQALEL